MAKTEDSFSSLKDLPKGAPRFLEPMKAVLEDELPEGADWLYEVKHDGIRAVAVKDGPHVRIFSRRPRELTEDHPGAGPAAGQTVRPGWRNCRARHGRALFVPVAAEPEAASRPLADILHPVRPAAPERAGHDLRAFGRTARASEETFAAKFRPLRFSLALEATASRVWQQAIKLGLEGVIAKRRDLAYEPGHRSGAWVKVKAQNEQEFVIGGYTPPRGSRKFFGSVLVGYYAGKDLRFASKVGTGYDFASLRSLHRLFQKFRTPKCPFANLPTKRDGRSGQGVIATEMKECVWLKPALVCQVRFLEWTRDSNLRQPVFLGLREDKRPTEVVREKPV